MTDVVAKRCFGVSWSATDPKCAGGLDPMYTDSDTKSHDRPRCDFFSVCGARKMANQQEQRLIQLRVQQAQQAAQQVPVQQVPVQQVQAQQVPQQQVRQPMQQQQWAPPPMMPPMPMMPGMMPPQFLNPMQMVVQAPMQLPVQQMMPVNHYMPGYLSMPEYQLSPGFGGYMGMMGRSILRAMFKAAGHTMANVLDTCPFGVPQQK